MPPQFTWRTRLSRGTSLFPDDRSAKENALVGAVVILQEEDDLPSTEALVTRYHPLFVDIVRRQLSCAFLTGVRQAKAQLAGQGHPFAAVFADHVARLEAACENCYNPSAPPPGGIGSSSQALSATLARLVDRADAALQAALKDRPWWIDLAPVNLDDYIGSKVFLSDFADLESQPERSYAIDMGDDTGSDDGDFRLHLVVRSRYAPL